VKRFLILLAAIGLVLSACGSDNDSDDANTGAGSDDKSESGGAALKKRLLTTEDLPSGFTQTATDSNNGDKDGDPSDDEEDDFCPQLTAQADQYKTDGEATVDFQNGSPGPDGAGFLNEQLEHFGSVDDANAAFDLAKKALADECKEIDIDGASGTFTPISFADLGDESFAVELAAKQQIETQTIDLTGHLVVVRDGDTIALLFSFGFGAKDLSKDAFESIARKAVARL